MKALGRAGWLLAVLLGAGVAAEAQWEIQDSHVTADLRGVDSVGGGVAWAAGSHGTILRTEDEGFVWQLCTRPPGGEDLDFRGVQAFDNETAIVMSSGPGDKSRLYKTTDGCQTWMLLFTNPDKEGFWDDFSARASTRGREIVLVGDPVSQHFVVYRTTSKGQTFSRVDAPSLLAEPGEGLFAASNSSLLLNRQTDTIAFGTGGPAGARVVRSCSACQKLTWTATALEVFAAGKSAGVFSLASHDRHWVAVGGDYGKPEMTTGTAAVSANNAATWKPATTLPGGYRSAVAYDAEAKAWITVGPNGTDVSTDDGRNWRALKPATGDEPDADTKWNALSLPFVVGPKGRIGILRQGVLPAVSTKPGATTKEKTKK